MRLHEIDYMAAIQNTENDRTSFDNFKKYMSIISAECSDILKLYRDKQQFLYRGVRYVDEDFLEQTTKENRPSVDTNNVIHNTFSKAFREHGFVVSRDNCAFMTARKREAGTYGKIFVAFPCNGFKYIWSNTISDFTASVCDIKSYYENNDDKIDRIPKGDEYEDYINNVVSTYSDSNLPIALDSKHEVMFTGKYYLISQIYEKLILEKINETK